MSAASRAEGLLLSTAKRCLTQSQYRLGLPAIAEDTLERCATEVQNRYAEPARYYHTAEHILDCLSKLKRFQELCTNVEAMQLALLYHDVVYDPKASDNESRSAELADTHFKTCFGTTEECTKLSNEVQRLILLTQHGKTEAGSEDADGKLLVDIDLSILGGEPDAFNAYDDNIRREYAFVPEEKYRAGRAAVLSSFLSKGIFATSVFREAYEQQAVQNIKRAIARLADSSIPLAT